MPSAARLTAVEQSKQASPRVDLPLVTPEPPRFRETVPGDRVESRLTAGARDPALEPPREHLAGWLRRPVQVRSARLGRAAPAEQRGAPRSKPGLPLQQPTSAHAVAPHERPAAWRVARSRPGCDHVRSRSYDRSSARGCKPEHGCRSEHGRSAHGGGDCKLGGGRSDRVL